MSKRHEMREAAERELDAAGIESRFEPTKGGHQKVIFVLAGREQNIIFPSTPSDHRAVLNMRSLIRRKIREARVHA